MVKFYLYVKNVQNLVDLIILWILSINEQIQRICNFKQAVLQIEAVAIMNRYIFITDVPKTKHTRNNIRFSI